MPAYRVLRTILREGKLNMRRFTEVSGNAPRHAKILREKLSERGYLVVHEHDTKRRITTDLSIELSAKGRKVAEHAEAIAVISEK